MGLLAAGSTREQILADYPYLDPEDIDEALQYAALLAEDEAIELARWNFLSICRCRRPWRICPRPKDTTPFTPMPWVSVARPIGKSCARQEARTVVTTDLDYPRLLALTGAEGPSLILFRGGDWSEPM